MKSIYKDSLLILALLLISIFYFFPLLSAKYVFVERDLSVFFIPPRYLWVELLKSFKIPLWNPHQYSGIPLLATLQPGVFYPPNLLFLFLPFNYVWNWLIILHFWFSGFTLYVFMRYIKASRLSSFASGVTFLLSGYLLSVHNLLPHLFSSSWFPLVLLNFLRSMEKKRGSIVATAICLTLQFLAGAPEIVIMTIFVLFVLFPFLSKKDFAYGLKALFFTLLLFLLLSSFQLLPFLELHLISIRRGGLSFFEATTWSMAFKDFLLFFLPDFYGYFRDDIRYWQNQCWLKTIYIGFAPFCLSTYYFLSNDKRKWVILLLLIISVLFALGKNTPLYRFIYHIPPLNSVRYPVKFLFLFFFCVSATTGLGLDVLIKDYRERKILYASKAFFYVGFLFFLGFSSTLLFKESVRTLFSNFGIEPPHFNDVEFNIHNLRRFFFFAFIFCLFPLFYSNLKWKGVTLSLAISILTLDPFLANYGYFRIAPWSLYMLETEIIKEMKKGKDSGRYFVTPRTSEEFKFFPENKIAPDPSYASLFRLYSIDGSEVMRVRWHNLYLSLIKSSPDFSSAKKYLKMGGVKYLISSREIEDPSLTEVLKVEEGRKKVHLYVQPDYIRAKLYHDVRFARSDDEAIKEISKSTFDPEKRVIVHFSSGNLLEMRACDRNGYSEIVEESPHNVKIKVNSFCDGFLFLSDTYYPGWEAYVDGKKVPIYRANISFRAIFVPKGSHLVEFKYRPLSFYLGLLLSLSGLILAFALKKGGITGESKGI